MTRRRMTRRDDDKEEDDKEEDDKKDNKEKNNFFNFKILDSLFIGRIRIRTPSMQIRILPAIRILADPDPTSLLRTGSDSKLFLFWLVF